MSQQYPPPQNLSSQYPQSQNPASVSPGYVPKHVVVAQETDWFPGYNAEIERNSSRQCLNWVLWTACLLLAIACIVVGIFVIQPGVVFKSFVPGNCSLSKFTFKKEKGCSCGKNCQSTFPCFSMHGNFYATSLNKTGAEMDFFRSYWDYTTDCVFKECQRNYDANVASIYGDATKFYEEHLYDATDLKIRMDAARFSGENSLVETLDKRIKFDCFGNNKDNAFLESLNSTVFIVCGCIPIIAFVIAVVAFIKCATPGMLLQTKYIVCCPFYLITDRENLCKYACNSQGPYSRGRGQGCHC